MLNGERLIASLDRDDDKKMRPKKFLCFNNEPRAHRKLNLMWLIDKKLFDQGLVSFNPKVQLLAFDRENILPEDSYFTELIKKYETIETQLPFIVDAPSGVHISFCRKWPFADTYFSFLTERVYNCQSGWTLLTPKVFKAICNMHPFIVLGQHGYLASLRSLGYKTFSPFINESYDQIDDPVLRTKAVWEEFERLVSMSLTEMHRWYYSMLPILEHNWNRFLERNKYSEFDDFVKLLLNDDKK